LSDLKRKKNACPSEGQAIASIWLARFFGVSPSNGKYSNVLFWMQRDFEKGVWDYIRLEAKHEIFGVFKSLGVGRHKSN